MTVNEIREAHVQQWASTSDEAWGQPGICAEDGRPWPCDTRIVLDALDDQRMDVLHDAASRVPEGAMTRMDVVRWVLSLGETEEDQQ